MANRSTKNHWNVLSMKLQMSLESHLATDTTVILPQNRMDLSAVIWSKNDRSAGKTDGWQRRKHPVTHLSQCTKEKSRSLSRRPAFSFAGIYKFIFESCSS